MGSCNHFAEDIVQRRFDQFEAADAHPAQQSGFKDFLGIGAWPACATLRSLPCEYSRRVLSFELRDLHSTHTLCFEADLRL